MECAFDYPIKDISGQYVWRTTDPQILRFFLLLFHNSRSYGLYQIINDWITHAHMEDSLCQQENNHVTTWASNFFRKAVFQCPVDASQKSFLVKCLPYTQCFFFIITTKKEHKYNYLFQIIYVLCESLVNLLWHV